MPTQTILPVERGRWKATRTLLDAGALQRPDVAQRVLQRAVGAAARGAVPHGGLDGDLPRAGEHVPVADEWPEAVRIGLLADACLLVRPLGVPLLDARLRIVAGRPLRGRLRLGQGDGCRGGLFVVLVQHAHHGGRRGMLAPLLARRDDKVAGDVAQAHLLPAQVERGG
jgi:hypothetical protein